MEKQSGRGQNDHLGLNMLRASSMCARDRFQLLTKAAPHAADPPAATCPTVLWSFKSQTPSWAEMVIRANIFMREENTC